MATRRDHKKKKQNKTRRQKRIQRKTKTEKRHRRPIRKISGGGFIMPLGSVIPYNNYLSGDVQRELVSTRIHP